MISEQYFHAFGYAKGSAQFEILRAIFLQGGIRAEVAERHGFTRRGIPTAALRDLVDRRIVAPQVITSQPLRLVWRLRKDAKDRYVENQIERDFARNRLHEHAPGGFRIDYRRPGT